MIDVVIQYIVGFLTSVGGGAVGMYVGYYILRKRAAFSDIAVDLIYEVAENADTRLKVKQIAQDVAAGLTDGLGIRRTGGKKPSIEELLINLAMPYVQQYLQGKIKPEQAQQPF